MASLSERAIGFNVSADHERSDRPSFLIAWRLCEIDGGRRTVGVVNEACATRRTLRVVKNGLVWNQQVDCYECSNTRYCTRDRGELNTWSQPTPEHRAIQ